MRGLERECFDGGGSRGRGTVQHWERFRTRGKNQPAYEGINAREISSKRPDIWGYDRRVYNQATVFFFTNFPDDWKQESMWQTFRKFGRVLDIYSPLRKSKKGSRFGFIRFLDVRNEWELEHQLDQIWVGEFKLWVNRPRFKGKESLKKTRAAIENGKQVKREKEHWQIQNSNPNRNPVKIWRVKDKKQVSDGIEFTVKEEEYSWLQGCYVGTAHSVEIILTLQEKFFMEGYFSCKVRAMGGRLVLLEGGDKEEIKDLGVPVHAWGPNFFATIGTKWGKFITLDDSTSKKQRFDIGRMLISTSEMDFISKNISIKVNGEPFTIKVMEEEATNGIFSMKLDHVFKELSGSDNESSESWSLGNGLDDELSDAFLGGGSSKNSRNTTGEKKDDNDVEVEEERRMEAETMDEQPHYRWNQKSQNSKGDQNSAVNDVSFNVDGSRDNLLPNGDDKIQYTCSSNNEGYIADKEVVLDSPEAQNTQNMDRRNVSAKDGEGNVRTVSTDLHNAVLELSFWKGFESESGHEQEWMGRKQRKPKRNRKKKSRSCCSVYMEEGKEERVPKPKERKRASKEQGMKERMPKFSPGSHNQVAGESVTDSGIENRNESLRRGTNLSIAEKIWAFAKEIGVGDRGNEREVIQKLEGMEDRDKELFRLSKVSSNTVLEGNGGGCWCLMGDFNAIRSEYEWNGGRSNRREMAEFDEFIRECGLIDLPLIGRKYTWYKPNRDVMSRLDRFLLSEDWCLKWGDLKQWGLKRTNSDHCPILMKNLTIDWGPKPFRFFDVWLNSPGCKEIVEEVWSSTLTSGWYGYRLKEKLNATKKALKVWSRNMVSKTDSNIKRYEEAIAVIDLKGEVAPLSEEEMGDKYMEQVDEIKEEFKKISAEDNLLLLAPFNEEEVKQAVWSCEGSKASGSDGFNFNFIREMWDLIRGDVMGFVNDFYQNGRLVKGANSSFIVLIPKVNNPQKIEEFRPISLIGVMYKVIAKLLANRISSVLDSIIGESQMAFLRGRQMVDSIVIANETIDAAKRNKKASFVFKLDFEKAYDKVCWEFLDYMMLRMGFDPKWRRWINECLKSVEVSVLLNGSTTRQVKMNRGLRQGDPLSPYLFLLVAEGFNGIISSAINQGLFEGVNIGNRGMRVSHLQFADDSILFGKVVEGNIWAAKSIMRIFELVSGLKINFGKSQLMGINVSDAWMSKMAHILNCKQGVFPCKYLGVPIGGSGKNIAMWKPLIETFEKKLSSWKGWFLSFGGRITLLNVVLSNLPVFTMSTHLLPKGGLIGCKNRVIRDLYGGGTYVG
ncbi:hypothetical protein SLEP1_g40435 [Rubroshorea leprosula]|uniref:Reverse transcriptase domain-containing protein n=1 Tax=Rubroshorea leprosula TaxID=152421 RepID=A0AAV5L3P1_9ROSI|nr:hypothetical protein SLEP1_g40435 [Rubroshorea leprosula]